MGRQAAGKISYTKIMLQWVDRSLGKVYVLNRSSDGLTGKVIIFEKSNNRSLAKVHILKTCCKGHSKYIKEYPRG